MNDFLDFAKFCAWPMVALVVFIAGTVALGYGCDNYNCSNLGTISGKETRYDVISGCFVKIDGQWVPVSRWRVTP